ncbi:hypothetical protein [Gluconobacter japonicus]|uniref:hypothetical protein n=1 Tax=Gluconobacter japonicus TaxID=376620 RepID=UPI0039E7F59F
MRRFLIVSLLVPSLAAAAPVFTPGGGIASSRNNPAYEIGQDGIARFSNIDPRTLLGGQSIPTVLSQMGQNTQGLATEIARAQSAEAQAVKQADVGTMVAGLDGAGNVTAPIQTSSAVFGPTPNKNFIPTVYSYINPQSIYAAQGTSTFWRWWDGNSTMRVGGTPITLPHSPYGNQAGTYQSIVLNGTPNGGYNAGCVLCVFMEPDFVKQAAVSAEPPQSGYVPSADGVELYGAVSNTNFDLIVPVASYTATTVVLKDVLSATELSHIQPGMTIFTNSQIPGVTASAPEAADYYMGVISSVSTTNNVTTITVYGWSQQLTTASGAVPSTTSLETYFWKGQTSAVVGIGGFNKGFGRNLFMSYDGSKSGATGNAATSLVHSYAGEEIDMHITNETRAGSVKVQAHTFAINIDPAHTNVITHDSLYAYVGGPLPTYFKTGDECYPDSAGVYDEGAYVSASAWIGGACKLGELESVLKRYDQEIVEFDGRTTGLGYPFRLLYHLSENTAGGGTTQSNVTPKLGIVLDGTQGQGVSNGSLLADLQWNWNGNSGGLALCGYGVNCGFLVDGNGVAHVAPGGAGGGNSLIVGTQLSGHVAALGEYVASDYIYDLLELAKGAKTEFSVNADGNVFADGTISANGGFVSGADITTGLGGSIVFRRSDGKIGTYLYNDAAGNLHIGYGAGGTGQFNVDGIMAASSFTSTALTGTGNAYACVNASGQIYRSATACN